MLSSWLPVSFQLFSSHFQVVFSYFPVYFSNSASDLRFIKGFPVTFQFHSRYINFHFCCLSGGKISLNICFMQLLCYYKWYFHMISSRFPDVSSSFKDTSQFLYRCKYLNISEIPPKAVIFSGTIICARNQILLYKLFASCFSATFSLFYVKFSVPDHFQ